MGLIKTNGIVLAENNMGDYDKMLTMLTPGLGRIGCAAKGARRPKSQLMAGTQFLCFGEYQLYKGMNYYTINSCDTIELFYPIRTDLDKLAYAAHITKIVLDVTTENQTSYRILQLVLNTLYVISEMDLDLEIILAVFQLRLLCLLGFLPNIRNCGNCKQKETIAYFSIKQNGFLCSTCGKQESSSIKISASTIDAIRYIVGADAKKLFSFQLPEEAKRELILISKIYTNEKLEKEYKLETLF